MFENVDDGRRRTDDGRTTDPWVSYKLKIWLKQVCYMTSFYTNIKMRVVEEESL